MSIFDPPPPEPVKIVMLGDAYAKAIIGHNVSVHDPPRLVYSLVLLTDLVRKRKGVTEEAARERVSAMVKAATKEHKASAPVFVDDSMTRISRTPAKEQGRIIRPGGWRPGKGK